MFHDVFESSSCVQLLFIWTYWIVNNFKIKYYTYYNFVLQQFIFVKYLIKVYNIYKTKLKLVYYNLISFENFYNVECCVKKVEVWKNLIVFSGNLLTLDIDYWNTYIFIKNIIQV